MPIDSKTRRELASKANRLSATLLISPETLNDGAIVHIRQALKKNKLIKVRLATESRDTFEAAAAQIAERVPCEIVQRLGRVVTLYSPASDDVSAVAQKESPTPEG